MLGLAAAGALLPSSPSFVGVGEETVWAVHPAQLRFVGQRKVLARIRLTREALEACRNAPPGAFVRACETEYGGSLRGVIDQARAEAERIGGEYYTVHGLGAGPVPTHDIAIVVEKGPVSPLHFEDIARPRYPFEEV